MKEMECEPTDAQNGGWNFKLSFGSLEPSTGGSVEISSLLLLLVVVVVCLFVYLFVCFDLICFVLFVCLFGWLFGCLVVVRWLFGGCCCCCCCRRC